MKQLMRGCVYSVLFVIQFIISSSQQAQAQMSFIDLEEILNEIQPQVTEPVASIARAPSAGQCFAECEARLRSERDSMSSEQRAEFLLGIKFRTSDGAGDSSSGSGSNSEPNYEDPASDVFPETPWGFPNTEEEGVSCQCESRVLKYTPLATEEDLKKEKDRLQAALPQAEQILSQIQCHVASSMSFTEQNGLFYGFTEMGEAGGFAAGQNLLSIGDMQLGHGIIGQYDEFSAKGIVGITIRISDRITFVCGLAIDDLTKPWLSL